MWDRILMSLLGVAFLLAGVLKWMDPAMFEKAIRAMQIVPARYALALALWLPAFEMLCGVLAVLGRRSGLLGCALMSLLFVTVLGIGLAKGTFTSCGCFGAWDPFAHRPWLSLIRALVFLFLAFGLYLRAIAARLD